ncbi:MAG: SpoIID/LytB domain-containing protein [Candidatus Omnitrophica bacterium]|nr:SpoIID/LytB domain-containing protein [Candidatus Omnitrophota bacterium]
MTLQIHGRFRMTDLASGSEINTGRRLESVAVRALPTGLALGEAVLPSTGVRVEPSSDAAIRLNGRRLRGTLEIVRQQNLTLLVVNYVALEDYLRGVLSKEAPDYWPEEALKAIAIAARTYAVYQRLTQTQVDYDVTGDVMSQDYGGKTAEKAATTRAVKATAGLILAHQDKLFPTFYHSTCGGMTEHGRAMGNFDLEPLQGGIACSLCSASPFFRWQRRITKADLGWALRKSPHGSIGTIRDVRVTKRTTSGRAQEITIVGALRTLQLTGYDLRSLLGFERIRSPLFSIQPVGDDFMLDGRGWGHGVGLCQWGAAELARRGLLAPEILAYYYRGAALVSLKDLSIQPIQIIGGSP